MYVVIFHVHILVVMYRLFADVEIAWIYISCMFLGRVIDGSVRCNYLIISAVKHVTKLVHVVNPYVEYVCRSDLGLCPKLLILLDSRG